MTVHSLVLTAGTAAIMLLCLVAPLTANLLRIMPKKWQLWMIGRRCDESH